MIDHIRRAVYRFFHPLAPDGEPWTPGVHGGYGRKRSRTTLRPIPPPNPYRPLPEDDDMANFPVDRRGDGRRCRPEDVLTWRRKTPQEHDEDRRHG